MLGRAVQALIILVGAILRGDHVGEFIGDAREAGEGIEPEVPQLGRPFPTANPPAPESNIQSATPSSIRRSLV